MAQSASDLAVRLAHDAEAVCHAYLSSGHKSGRYWIVGNVRNTKGRSMFVRLTGPEAGKGAAGKWVDNVALQDMLRCRVLPLLRMGVRGSAQHNSVRLRWIW